MSARTLFIYKITLGVRADASGRKNEPVREAEGLSPEGHRRGGGVPRDRGGLRRPAPV